VQVPYSTRSFHIKDVILVFSGGVREGDLGTSPLPILKDASTELGGLRSPGNDMQSHFYPTS
jgi:hypothetical protein